MADVLSQLSEQLRVYAGLVAGTGLGSRIKIGRLSGDAESYTGRSAFVWDSTLPPKEMVGHGHTSPTSRICVCIQIGRTPTWVVSLFNVQAIPQMLSSKKTPPHKEAFGVYILPETNFWKNLLWGSFFWFLLFICRFLVGRFGGFPEKPEFAADGWSLVCFECGPGFVLRPFLCGFKAMPSRGWTHRPPGAAKATAPRRLGARKQRFRLVT